MKNWKVILWLILFFPIGLYLMYKQTDWSKPLKYGLTGFYALASLVGGVELWANLFFMSSFLVIIAGLFSLFRKSSRRQGIGILVLGVLLLSFTYPVIDAQVAEQERIEQQELEAQAEVERLAEEKRLEEIAKREEQERIEEEKRLKEKIVEAIKIVEDEPIQINYDKATVLLESLDDEDTVLAARLDQIKPAVEDYEEKLLVAKQAVEQAKEEKNRSTYDEAYQLVSALSVSNTGLNNQLNLLDREITEIEEEERIAAEKAAEEEQKAREQAEEERRVAAEAEAERQASQQASVVASQKKSSSGSSGGNSSSGSAGTTAATPAPVAQAGQYVDENGNGLIKGSKNGIYHVPGSTYYSRTTNPAAWFKTVQEAKNAGYRAPKR